MRAPDLGDFETPVRPPEVSDSVQFDYGMLAESFIGRGQGAKYRTITYRRYARGAEAIRYAIEELPVAELTSTVLQADEIRFDFREIRKLYDGPDYPLQRGRNCAVRSDVGRAPMGALPLSAEGVKPVPSIPKSSPGAERRAEIAARQKTRKGDPYLERQARRDAAPPLKRVVRETVPYLERQAARAADKAAGRSVARNSDEQEA